MRIYRIPFLFHPLFPTAITRIRDAGNKVFLTFDDGPAPHSSGVISTLLKNYEIPATFFCLGSSVEAYPDDFNCLINNGFRIANHGYRHLNGWKTETGEYLRNVKLGSDITGSNLFRPPYGKLTVKQAKILSVNNKIILWDLMLYDFDRSVSADSIIETVERKTRAGSVIVLHDNEKYATPHLLERIINLVKRMGFEFGDLGEALGD